MYSDDKPKITVTFFAPHLLPKSHSVSIDVAIQRDARNNLVKAGSVSISNEKQLFLDIALLNTPAAGAYTDTYGYAIKYGSRNFIVATIIPAGTTWMADKQHPAYVSIRMPSSYAIHDFAACIAVLDTLTNTFNQQFLDAGQRLYKSVEEIAVGADQKDMIRILFGDDMADLENPAAAVREFCRAAVERNWDALTGFMREDAKLHEDRAGRFKMRSGTQRFDGAAFSDEPRDTAERQAMLGRAAQRIFKDFQPARLQGDYGYIIADKALREALRLFRNMPLEVIKSDDLKLPVESLEPSSPVLERAVVATSVVEPGAPKPAETVDRETPSSEAAYELAALIKKSMAELAEMAKGPNGDMARGLLVQTLLEGDRIAAKIG